MQVWSLKLLNLLIFLMHRKWSFQEILRQNKLETSSFVIGKKLWN